MARLRWHVGALAVLLIATWPLLDLDGVFISDEGSYAIQAEVLRSGTWDMGYPFAHADPAITYPAFHAGVVSDGGVVPYPDHPTWPAMLAATSSLVGPSAGLRVLGVASLVVLAAAAWGIGTKLGGQPAAMWGFWFAASSSILAHAFMMWAHAPSAAAGAVLVLAALRSRTSRPWLAAAVLAATVGVLLRSEGILWAGAVTVAVFAVGRDWSAARRAAAVAAGAAIGYWAEALWVRSIVDRPASDLSARGAGASILERPDGLRIALLEGAFVSSPGKLLGLGAVTLAVVGTVALRRRRPDIATVAFLVAAVLVLARLVAAPHDPVPGLLVAAPVLMLAAAWRPSADDRAIPALATLLFLAVLALTIYPDGGAFQWGGRLVSPAVAAVSAMAACSVVACQQATRRSDRQRVHLLGSLVVLCLAQAALSIIGPNMIRSHNRGPVDRVLDAGSSIYVADGTQIARLDWTGWPERCWIAVPKRGDSHDLAAIFGILADSGVREATFVGFTSDEVEQAGALVTYHLEGLDAGRFAIPGIRSSWQPPEPYRCDS